jgi:hypothetical protein
MWGESIPSLFVSFEAIDTSSRWYGEGDMADRSVKDARLWG